MRKTTVGFLFVFYAQKRGELAHGIVGAAQENPLAVESALRAVFRQRFRGVALNVK